MSRCSRCGKEVSPGWMICDDCNRYATSQVAATSETPYWLSQPVDRATTSGPAAHPVQIHIQQVVAQPPSQQWTPQTAPMGAAPIAKKRRAGAVAGGIAAVCALFAVFAYVSNSRATASLPGPATTPVVIAAAEQVTVGEFLTNYSENEVRADLRFKGRRVLVTGTIEGVGKDNAGDSYVSLSDNAVQANLKCVFDKGDEAAVATMAKGMTVVLEGTVHGRVPIMVGDISAGTRIDLMGCRKGVARESPMAATAPVKMKASSKERISEVYFHRISKAGQFLPSQAERIRSICNCIGEKFVGELDEDNLDLLAAVDMIEAAADPEKVANSVVRERLQRAGAACIPTESGADGKSGTTASPTQVQ